MKPLKGAFNMSRDIVTSENRQEYMEKKLGKEEDKPKFSFPHYGIGDLVRTGGTGHMMVTEHDAKNKGYIGHAVNEYGETEEPKRQKAVLHEDVGTGKHHLYAKHGDYPQKEEAPKDRAKKMAKSEHERVKNHPKYEKLKSALGKRGATDALLKELNDAQ